MESKLILSVCNYLIPEVAQVITKDAYPDVHLMGFPANCNSGSISFEKVSAMALKSEFRGSDIVLIGGTCHNQDFYGKGFDHIDKVHLGQCFEIFCNHEIIQQYTSKGYYLVSNGWLKTTDQHIKNWGFDAETAKIFFGESLKGVLLLDTQITTDYLADLKKISDYMGLPYEIISVGLSHCKLYFESLIFNWRNKKSEEVFIKEISEITKKNADFSMVYSTLEDLIKLTKERDIVNVGFDLINVLFAPSKIRFKTSFHNTTETIEFKGMGNQTEPTDENSFAIDIVHSDDLLGVFHVIGVQFPQFIDEYKKLGKLISQIFGLALANAYKYEITLKQKEQIEETARELLKSNRSKDIFFSIIAHDLKGPLGSILGISELIQDAVASGGTQINEYSKLLHQGLTKTYNLIINLLEWSRSQTDHIEFSPNTYLLASVIDEIYLLLSESSDRKLIKLKHTVLPETEVFADENMLQTILRNLISNAIKYTRGGGIVSISASEEEQMLHLTIADNGIGMPPERLKQLFQIEYVESRPGTENEKGTGLGLILCKEFMDKHQGKIWAESDEEKGSTFHLIFPLKQLS